jgi:hypothetical protein
MSSHALSVYQSRGAHGARTGSRANLPATVLESAGSPSHENHPPSAPEEVNVNNALHFPPLGSQSVAAIPTPSTPISSLRNLDNFIHTLNQELHHSPK